MPPPSRRRPPPSARDDWPLGLPPLRSVSVLSGGLICTTERGQLADGLDVVVKRCPYPAEVEADGLQALAAAGVPVPAVVGVGRHVLVLEYVSGEPDWPALGAALARMHRSTGPRYGWHRDNSGGDTTQENAWCDDWPTFFVERRVRAHLRDPRLSPDLRTRLDRACEGPLPALLPDRPRASLTHGDLWLGNVVDGRWIIDPAVSYADRELDLVFIQMSDTLPPEFLATYLEEWPLAEDYEHRRPALQLHKLLNNVRHFGDRLLPPIVAVLDHYGW